MEVDRIRESEHEAADALVSESGLPVDDLDKCRQSQFVIRDGARIVATAALEVRDQDAILRSVAVEPGHRGERLGERIVAHAIGEARAGELSALYLLTETAAGVSPRFGFVIEPRESPPPAIQASAEYCHVCGSGAIAMALHLVSGE